jgi:hypothetical protein
MTVQSTPVRILACLAGLVLLVGGCGAAAHLNALQPPSVETAGAIVNPVDHQPLAASQLVPPFQAGIDVDWYHYRGQSVALDAFATATYIQRLNANSVSISFPIFIHGTRSSSVHATGSTPSPAQLATAIGIFKQSGFYVSLRPLLDEKSLAHSRVSWVPASQRAWFRSYQRFLKPYAQMAGHARVNEFIIGTGLSGISLSPTWARLARLIRSWYHGTLACADGRDHILARGCGVASQTADVYHPAHITRRFLSAWEQWDRTLPGGMAETEASIAAAEGAQYKPWILNWPVHSTDSQLQARWFAAACQAAAMTHLGGIYFSSVGLTPHNRVGPALASQTTWIGGPGARAIARCFASIDRTHQ